MIISTVWLIDVFLIILVDSSGVYIMCSLGLVQLKKYMSVLLDMFNLVYIFKICVHSELIVHCICEPFSV